MADNTQINLADVPGGDIIATDDIGGVKHQLVKIEYGAADSATQVSGANPLPVTDAAVLAKLSSDPATQTTLAAILAKIISAPSTEAKQDALNSLITTLNSIVSTAAKQDTGNTSLASIDSKLTGGSQKSQVVDGSGNVIGSTSNALDINIKSGNPSSISVSNFPATQNVSVTSSVEVEVKNDTGSAIPTTNSNIDVALSTRLKPADTLTKVSTVDTITNVVHVDDNAGSLTVDSANLDVALSTRLKPADTLAGVTAVGSITNPLPAGTNLLGKVGIDQTTPGTTNGVQVNAALPTGANYIGYVNPDIGPTAAQNIIAPATGAGNSFAISGMQFAGLIISGSASNFIFKAQITMNGGTNWDDTYMVSVGGTASQTASINGQYQILIANGTTHVRVVLNSINAGTFTYQYTANMAGNGINLSVSTPGFNAPPASTYIAGLDSNGKLQPLSTTTAGILNVTTASLPLPSNAAKETGGNLDSLVSDSAYDRRNQELQLIYAASNFFEVVGATEMYNASIDFKEIR